ncbi:MAG: chloramphenicol phosphotransferase, partial [Rhizobiaceae bacterium]|nr:chloramphenicol phosphotransferase [Rhizobiaceae bacterium]
MAKILLLNGVGSAGKSSIARALQAIAAEPFLHVQMDV